MNHGEKQRKGKAEGEYKPMNIHLFQHFIKYQVL